MKRRSVVGGLAAMAAAGLGGCARKSITAESGQGSERASPSHLRRHAEDSPRTLDPALNTDLPAMQMIDDLFEGLLRLDPAGNSVPAVATRWSQSDDGLTWTFELRRDARWSNGDVVTAHDFVYAWRRLFDPATRSQMVQSASCIVNGLAIARGELKPEALGVVAKGDFALEVRLVSRTAWLPYLLTTNFLMPVHRGTVETHGERWTRPGNLVSNGAFFLADQRIDGPVRLERNPHHPEAQGIRLESVTHFPVPDRNSVTSRYLAGDLDVTNGFQITDVHWLREQLGSEVSLTPYFGTVMLGFHPNREPFDNRALREAMNMAIDREVLTGKLLRGLFLPAYNIVPPVPGYEPAVPEWASWPADRRHARAREL
ncbi:MAG: peptide ABC transporter substrate-binding protein, partial [Steroidobacteraceae bacterium]